VSVRSDESPLLKKELFLSSDGGRKPMLAWFVPAIVVPAMLVIAAALS
jgi:hypothetical protein